MTKVICLLSLVFFPLFLFSQQPDSSSAAAVQQARITEVVIQATRTSAQSPVPHYNLKAAEIKRILHAQDVPFLLSGTPSLVESSDAGTGIGYTGLRIRGSDPTRVNVTINGIPLNDAESQNVFWVDLPDLAASASEIQVQRGVGASTNGAGAFGATVNLDLSNIQAEAGASLATTIGSFGTRRLTVQANTGLLGKWAFAGRASAISSEGFIDRASADLGAAHFTGAYLGARHTLQTHILLGREITYQAWNGVPAQYLSDARLRTFNTAGMERPGMPYDQEVDHYNQRHFLLHYKFAISEQVMLQLNAHYTKGFGYYEQYKADQAFADYGLSPWILGDTSLAETDLIRRRWLDNDFYGATFVLRWNQPGVSRATYSLGGAASKYSGRHFGEIIWSEYPIGQSKDYRYYDNTAEKTDGNLYLKIEKTIFKRLTAYLDLQGRLVQYQFQGFDQDFRPAPQDVRHFFFNPKAGATFQMTSGTAAYVFWGVAHREPNRDDYTQSTPQSRPKAERLNDWEVGLRVSAGNMTFNGNLYYMGYQNQLVLDGRINDVGAYIRTNVPKSYRAGVELEGSCQLNKRLALNANFSLSRNKVSSFTEFRDNWDTWAQEVVVHRQTNLAFSPAVVSRGELRYTFWHREHGQTSALNHRSGAQVTGTLVGKYVGKQYLDNTSNEAAVLPAYLVSDIRINADFTRFLGRECSLVLSCNNWLDAQYSANGWVYRFISAAYDPRPDDPYTVLEGAQVYHQAGYFPQAGRHWMATLRFGF